MNGQFDLGELRPSRYFLAVAMLIGVMFAFIAPDDELPNGWFAHALQWQIQVLAPMLVAIAIHLKICNITALSDFSPWLKLGLSGLLAALLCTPIALLSDVILANEDIGPHVGLALANEFLSTAPPITLFWVAINAPFQLGWRVTRAKQEQSPLLADTEQTRQPAFFDLVPQSLRGNLIYLKSELHYLSVVTDKGKSLILYSLKQAIRELEVIDGLQPHRSYWVNPAYISDRQKTGREGELSMSDGAVIPVSRAKIAEVMAAQIPADIPL